MLLDNILPPYIAAFGAPACFLKRLRYPSLVSFGLLASLATMRSRRVIKDIDSIWDVGANEGQFAFMASSVWPELPIYSFEPDPVVYKKLCSNFIKHKIHGRTHELALADTEGDKQFLRYESNVNNSFLERDKSVDRTGNQILVSCKTLDVISTQLPEVKSAFLKLDVQGFELEVIAGARNFLKRCRYVQIEVSFSSPYSGGANADQVLLAMRQLGFECIEILDLLRDKKANHKIIEADLLFQRIQSDT